MFFKGRRYEMSRLPRCRLSEGRGMSVRPIYNGSCPKCGVWQCDHRLIEEPKATRDSGQPIPDEAVEAAVGQWFDQSYPHAKRVQMRNALTAALPHLEAAIRADERAKVRERIEAEVAELKAREDDARRRPGKSVWDEKACRQRRYAYEELLGRVLTTIDREEA